MKQCITQRVKILTTWAVGLLVFSGLTATSAWAVPVLQIYIDGATYDTTTETWVIQTGSPFDLWVIGNVGGEGAIADVKLAGAVATSEVTGSSIVLTPTTAGRDIDPSTPDDDLSIPGAPTATSNVPSVDGAVPERGDGTSLPAHGIYGPGTSFFEWDLGDMTLTDSPVGDFINTFPTSFPQTGQINVYTVTVTGFTQVHFDAYDHIYDGDQHGEYKFAPFSHDGGAVVPEAGTWLLMGTGLIGLLAYSWQRKRHRLP